MRPQRAAAIRTLHTRIEMQRTMQKFMATVLALGSLALLAPAPAAAQESWNSPELGKHTLVNVFGRLVALHGWHRSDCPSGQYLIGLSIRSGIVVDGIRPECARLGPNGEHRSFSTGTWLGSEVVGNASTLRCPSGQVVVGFRGRAADLIDRIQFACRRWKQGEGTHGPTTWQAARGGTGGEPYGAVVCPGTLAAYGLDGAAALTFLRMYGFACRG